jgi:hypothetical protein
MNKRNTARIAKITNICKIEEREYDILTIDNGWQVVSDTGKYKINDEVTFIPYGSWVPSTLLPIVESAKYKGINGGYLTVMKICGEISEGIVLDSEKYNENLEVRVWERDLPEIFYPKDYRTFPTFIPKINYPHAQDISNLIFSKNYGETFEITPRLDGIDVIFYVKQGKFGICSERYEIIEHSEDPFWNIAYKLNIPDSMIDYRDQYAIYGTIVGDSIYFNNERIYGEQKLYIHEIYDLDKTEFLTPKKRYEVFSSLAEYCKFDHVQVFNRSTKVSEIADNIRQLVDYANGTSMTSLSKRKGLIFKSTNSELKFKVRSNNYHISNKL